MPRLLTALRVAAPLVLTTALLSACAADVAAEQAGAWVADQPHVAKVLDDHAKRQGELSVILSPSSAFVEAELEPGTRPVDLADFPAGLRERIEASRSLAGLTVRLHGPDFSVDLRGDVDVESRKLAVAEELVSMPGVEYVDLTSASPAAGRGPAVRLDSGTTSEVAPAVFAEAARLGAFRMSAQVTAPGQPTVRTETARALPAATARLLVDYAGLPGVSEVAVGPTEGQLQSRWRRDPGQPEPVEEPGLSIDAKVMTVRAASPRRALDLRGRALELLSRSGDDSTLTVTGGPLALDGSADLPEADAARLLRLAEADSAVEVRWSPTALEVQLTYPRDFAAALGSLPDVPRLRLRSVAGGSVDLRGTTREVLQLAPIAEAALTNNTAFVVVASRDVVELQLTTAEPVAFGQLSATVHRLGWPGDPEFVVSARIDDDSLVELRFRPGPDGRATALSWSRGNFPEGDADAVEQAARDLVAAWDATL